MIKFIIFLIIIFTFSFSKAEDSLLTLKQQLDRLQREVNDLSKTVFKNDQNNGSFQKEESTEAPSNFTAFDLRIYDLEKDIRKLNENFEELIFQIDDLNIIYKKISLDLSTLQLNGNNISNRENNNVNSDQAKNLGSKETNVLGSIVINTEDLSSESEKVAIDINNDELENQNNIKIKPEEAFQRAFDMLRSQQFDNSKEMLILFIENYPDDKLSGSAHYWLGEIYLLKKEYRNAALILAEGFQKFPSSAKSPEMLYKLSDSLLLIDKKSDACNTLNKLMQEFPKHKILNKAKSKIKSLNCPNPSG